MRSLKRYRLPGLVMTGAALLGLSACDRQPSAIPEGEAVPADSSTPTTEVARPVPAPALTANDRSNTTQADTSPDQASNRVSPTRAGDDPASVKPAAKPAAASSSPKPVLKPTASPTAQPEMVDPHAGHDMQPMPDHDMSDM